jgi:hypothetical protein
MNKVSEIAAKAKESLLQTFILILFFPDLNKIMKFSCFDVYFEVIPKIGKRPFYFIITLKVRFYFERREDFGTSAESGETLRTK